MQTPPSKIDLNDENAAHEFVIGFASEVMAAYDRFLQGRTSAAEAQAKIDGMCRQCGDAFMGRDDSFQIASWQGKQMRGKLLAFLPAMRGDDDPGEALFRHYGLMCVKACMSLADGHPEEIVGDHLEEILEEARDLILGRVV